MWDCTWANLVFLYFKHFDKLKNLLDNAYFSVLPPEEQSASSRPSVPPILRFIRRLVSQPLLIRIPTGIDVTIQSRVPIDPTLCLYMTVLPPYIPCGIPPLPTHSIILYPVSSRDSYTFNSPILSLNSSLLSLNSETANPIFMDLCVLWSPRFMSIWSPVEEIKERRRDEKGRGIPPPAYFEYLEGGD